ncbi:hypothetical protein GQ600_26963 [Phytophthora cactorum]|nr:hypothetical protein GQ600_26963 [Phytophthora cactorum]
MRDNILRVTEAVEDKVAQEMPDNFGIIFDGWSNDSEHYLAAFATYEVDDSSATIVGGPYYKSAVVKLQRGRPLGRQEKTALSVLKVASGRPSADNPDDGFAERVLQRACVSEQTDKYILVAAILLTSSIVERLFSMARAMIGLERHSLQMIMVEAKLFLKRPRAPKADGGPLKRKKKTQETGNVERLKTAKTSDTVETPKPVKTPENTVETLETAEKANASETSDKVDRRTSMHL